MSALKRLWAWLACTDAPPPPVREHVSERRRKRLYALKRAELQRAYRRSELDNVRRLTAECSELKREMGTKELSKQ